MPDETKNPTTGTPLPVNPVETISQGGTTDTQLNPPNSQPEASPAIDPAQPDSSLADAFFAKQKDINDRKAGFRKDLQEIVNKWQIFPDYKTIYTNHGPETGVILADFKYGNPEQEVTPSVEDELKMNEIIMASMISRNETQAEQSEELPTNTDQAPA